MCLSINVIVIVFCGLLCTHTNEGKRNQPLIAKILNGIEKQDGVSPKAKDLIKTLSAQGNKGISDDFKRKLMDFYSETLTEEDTGSSVISYVVEALFYVYAEINDLPVDELNFHIEETSFIVGIFYYLFKQYPEHLNYFDEVNSVNFKKEFSSHALAARSWIGWWTFMIVTDNRGDGNLSVVCYTLEDSNDCLESETIFAFGYGKTLVLKEVDLNVNKVRRKLYSINYPLQKYPTTEIIKRAKSIVGYTINKWIQWFSNTSEHIITLVMYGEAKSFQIDAIKWELKKQTFYSIIQVLGKEGSKAAISAYLELGFVSYEFYSLHQRYKNGQISYEEYCKDVTTVLLRSAGSVSASLACGSIGTAIYPGVGTLVGAFACGVGGYVLFHVVGSSVADVNIICYLEADTGASDEDAFCDQECEQLQTLIVVPLVQNLLDAK